MKKTCEIEIIDNFPLSVDQGVRIINLFTFFETGKENLNIFFPDYSGGSKTVIVKVQSRAAADSGDWIENLADRQINGDHNGVPWDWDFNPPVLYGPEKTSDGISIYYLTNGIHRFSAALHNNYASYPKVEVRLTNEEKTLQQSALEEACGPVNRIADKPEKARTNNDKRKSIYLLFQNGWWNISDVKVGKFCEVSHELVRQCRTAYLDLLDSPDQLKKWDLRIPQNPEDLKDSLKKEHEMRPGVGRKDRKPKPEKVSNNSQEELFERSKTSKCTFTIEPEERDALMTIVDKEGFNSVSSLIKYIIANYDVWMSQIEGIHHSQ